MECNVCGTKENVHCQMKKRQDLCDKCNRETPNKIPLSIFDMRYWGSVCCSLPIAIRWEVFLDYLKSPYNFYDYERYVHDCI